MKYEKPNIIRDCRHRKPSLLEHFDIKLIYNTSIIIDYNHNFMCNFH